MMADKKDSSCETCKFRSGGGYHEREVGLFTKRIAILHLNGQCRLHAPTVSALSTKSRAMTVTEWPSVAMWDWCGDYERKTDE